MSKLVKILRVLLCFQWLTPTSGLVEIWIISSSIFSRKVSLRAQVSIRSCYLYSKCYHSMLRRFFLVTLLLWRRSNLEKQQFCFEWDQWWLRRHWETSVFSAGYMDVLSSQTASYQCWSGTSNIPWELVAKVYRHNNNASDDKNSQRWRMLVVGPFTRRKRTWRRFWV